MPQFIQQFASFPWAAVLTAVVTVATAVHVAALALGQKWPFFLKVASISGALAIDAQKIIGWFGGAPVYTSIAAKKLGKAVVDDAKEPPANGQAVAGLVLLALTLSGCSSFMHFSDPSLDDTVGNLCSSLAVQNKATLEAEAAKQKLSFDVIKDIFEAACALRVKEGLEPAKAAGLAAARHEVAP